MLDTLIRLGYNRPMMNKTLIALLHALHLTRHARAMEANVNGHRIRWVDGKPQAFDHHRREWRNCYFKGESPHA